MVGDGKVLPAFDDLDLGFGEAVQLIDQGIDGAMDVLWAGTSFTGQRGLPLHMVTDIIIPTRLR